MAQLKLRDVRKSFGQLEIIHGVDLDIAHGEFVVFVGPSGCGKSTLLRLISGLETLSEGTIHIDDADVSRADPADRGVAMVFQSYALYPHMTVAENMSFGLRMAKTPKAEIERRVDKAARILQLDELLARQPKALSGGQRQRVAIGRAIVREPKVFLFDEPLSNLDAELRVQMRVELAKLHGELDATMIYVTHDQVEAMTLADKIVVLRNGRIEQVGPPIELYERPANAFVGGFIGSPKMNFVDAAVRSTSTGTLDVKLPKINNVRTQLTEYDGQTPVGADMTLGIRPEDLEIGSEHALCFDLKVELAEQLGGVSYIYGRSNDGERVTVESKGYVNHPPGTPITVSVAPEKCHLFDHNGLRV